MKRLALFDSLEIGLVVADHDLRIRRVNAAACRILGRAEGELVGELGTDLLAPGLAAPGGPAGRPPADHPTLLLAPYPGERPGDRPGDRPGERAATAAAVTRAPGRRQQLTRLTRPDGTVVHVLTSATDTLDPIDGLPCLLIQIQDVTDLVAAHFQLDLVLAHIPVAMFLLARDGRVLASMGSQIIRAAGLGTTEPVTVFELFADLPDATRLVRAALRGRPVREVIAADGRWLDLHLVPMPESQRHGAAVAVVVTDVTDGESALRQLRKRSAEQALLVELGQRALDSLTPEPLLNRAAAAIAEHLAADLVTIDLRGEDPASAPGEPAMTAAAGRRAARDLPESRPKPRDGGGAQQGGGDGAPRGASLTVPIGRPDDQLGTVTVERNGSPQAAFAAEEVTFVRSVAALLGSAALRFRMEREAHRRSLYDPLTELPNRAAILERLQRALDRARADRRRIGVLFIDLDGFKAVNDTLGHWAGDALLREVANRLRRCVRPGDTVGRLAGDEFAILCENITNVAALQAIADRVLEALGRPVDLHEQVTVTGSVGLALSGPELDDPEALLNAADMAMYEAKRSGPGRSLFYRERMRTEIADRLRDTSELHRALAAEELHVRYQPIWTLDGVLVGAEALPFWAHSARGMLGPEQIRPVAATAGLQHLVDQQLIMQACRAAAAWPVGGDSRAGGTAPAALPGRADGGPGGTLPRLLIQVGSAVIAEPEGVAELEKLLRATGVGTRYQLYFAIPEPLFIEFIEQLRNRVVTWRPRVRVYVNYSGSTRMPGSVSGLPPLDGLRFGPEHVQGVESDPLKQALIASAVRFNSSLGMEVIAYGIETPEQLRTLRALGCDLGQGPLLGEPAPGLPAWPSAVPQR